MSEGPVVEFTHIMLQMTKTPFTFGKSVRNSVITILETNEMGGGYEAYEC